MASSTVCSNCVRRLAVSRLPERHFLQSRAFGNARRSIHTPAPLHLDFLAPSWRVRGPRDVARGSRKTEIPVRTQIRSLSTTAVRQATAITNPRKDDDGNEMTINITPRAAHRLQAIAEKDGNPDLALRVSVESGGCHGFQYLMNLIKTSDIDSLEDTPVRERRSGQEGWRLQSEGGHG